MRNAVSEAVGGGWHIEKPSLKVRHPLKPSREFARIGPNFCGNQPLHKTVPGFSADGLVPGYEVESLPELAPFGEARAVGHHSCFPSYFCCPAEEEARATPKDDDRSSEKLLRGRKGFCLDRTPNTHWVLVTKRR